VPTMATMAINQLTILAILLFEKDVKFKMLMYRNLHNYCTKEHNKFNL